MSRFSELKAAGPCCTVTNSPITRESKGNLRGRTAPTALLNGGPSLETILVLGLIAFGGYKLLKFNTAAGKEAVRAHSYLEILRKGASVEDANAITDKFLSDMSSDIAGAAITMARLEYEQVHKGKKLPLIGYAYRRGLRPAMPDWYTSFVRKVPETATIELCYRVLKLAPVNQHGAGADADDEAGFKAFYETFADEVQRIWGELPGSIRIMDLVEDEPLRRAYRDGFDPLVLAIQQCAHLGKIERFPNYRSYEDALGIELKRICADSNKVAKLMAQIDAAWLRDKFADGIHPRLVAAACCEAAAA